MYQPPSGGPEGGNGEKGPMHRLDRKFQAWQKTQDRLKGFDDLLMRLRTFALPLIVTVIGAGSALLADQPKPDVHWSVVTGLGGAGALVLLALFAAMSQRWGEAEVEIRKRQDQSNAKQGEVELEWKTLKGTRASGAEVALWLLIAVSLGSWAVAIGLERPDTLSLAGPALAFGGALLFLIYLVDRYYYHALLLGAVARARRLEDDPELDLGLTNFISDSVSDFGSDTLPVALYLLPTLVLVNLGMAVMAFSGS